MNTPSRGQRLRTATVAALLALGLSTAARSAEPALLAGTWLPVTAYSPTLRTIDGKAPPLTAAARALLARRVAARAQGQDEDPVKRCLRPGTPRILFQARPMQLLQTPRKITFLHEFQHVVRHVYLDEPLPPAEELDSTFGGTAVGHFEGSTLVVQSTGFSELNRLDEAGLPESGSARITERLRLLDPQTLEDVVRIDDARNYRRPWRARVVFRRAQGVDLKEDICAEKLLSPALRESLGRPAGAPVP